MSMKLSIGTNTLKFICDKIATKKNASTKYLENENKIKLENLRKKFDLDGRDSERIESKSKKNSRNL